MAKLKQGEQPRRARIQVQMSEQVHSTLDALALETGLPRVVLGGMALSIGVVSLKNAVEAARSGDPMAAAPQFLAEVSAVLAGYQLEGDDEAET